MKKIIAFEDIGAILPLITKKNKVLVGGCFDVFHYGHLTFLKNAKREGDFLIVALESDEFIKKHKKRDPIHNQNQRAEILSANIFVDMVVVLPLLKSNEEYFHLVKLIKPSVIATTEGDPQLDNKKRQAQTVSGQVKVVTRQLPHFASSRIDPYETFSRS